MSLGPTLFKTVHKPPTSVPKDRKRRVLIVDERGRVYEWRRGGLGWD